MPVLQRIAIAFAFLMLSAGAATASANDIYIAQSAAGAANGADCADALGMTYLNVAGNWTAGTTFHLCGTFNITPGTGITVLGSGTSGNPITVKLETGAVIESPYIGNADLFSAACSPLASCEGGLTVYHQNYVILDGGSN